MPQDPLKILIVEDEEQTLKALAEKFSREGFRIISARDGEEGLKVAFQERPHLILLDILMPRMGGEEMLAILRQQDWGKDTPVMILTNLSSTERVSKVLEQGAYDEFLVKSNWTLSDLVKKVKERLGVSC
jgi:two-component system alkaline phosphatase synthesis response regulator PhoP